MSQVICNYAPLRFLPYREVGEFVTVGVVMHCPNIGFFGHRLISTKRTGRVASFFPELDLRIYKAAMQGISRELKRVGSLERFTATAELPLAMMQRQVGLFQNLIRRREGLLHFGDPGSLVAESADEALRSLYDRFVERQFAHRPEYQETVMRKQLSNFLDKWKLAPYYDTNVQVGDDDFHIKLPFVHQKDGRAEKVIKPLNLDRTEATEVYHHGGVWVKNVERLQQRHQMPPSAVFTLRFPQQARPLDAANTIRQELCALGVQVVDFANVQEIHAAVKI